MIMRKQLKMVAENRQIGSVGFFCGAYGGGRIPPDKTSVNFSVTKWFRMC